MNSSLEISVICKSLDGVRSMNDIRNWKKCEGCHKISCVCGELTKSPTFKLRSRISPNNFKHHVSTIEKAKSNPGLGCIVSPNFSGSSSFYIPYFHSKKKINFESTYQQGNIFKSSSTQMLCPNLKSRLSISSLAKLNFEKDSQLKEKIINLGLKYVADPETRYQRKRLLELLYNLIRKGEKVDYACTTKGKLDEISSFLIKHNNELNFEKFLFKGNDNDHALIQRFDEFLKTFSTSIWL